VAVGERDCRGCGILLAILLYKAGDRNKPDQADGEQVHHATSVACVIEDEEVAEGMTVSDANILPLYNVKQKDTADDVVVNPDLTTEQ